jgi:hypothetical protein
MLWPGVAVAGAIAPRHARQAHVVGTFPGAERMVDFQVSKVVQLDHPSGALSWSVPEYSRFNPPASPTDPDEA